MNTIIWQQTSVNLLITIQVFCYLIITLIMYLFKFHVMNFNTQEYFIYYEYLLLDL